ncbi:MAG: hypothetical protein IJS10_02665 [Alphaproteobacteria bacterium]|nr:hypothetical protein [Alphaproteobacteria bacterium]
MKALLRLAVSTVVVATNVQADVVMAEFELDLEHRDIGQLEAISKQDINVAFGVDAFTEHYRAYMWDIRNNYENTPEENEIVRYESLKYYNTVYKLIPTEIARCIFGIKGGTIEYTDDYDEILECKGSVPVEQYNQSNWNYVVFVNVLNRYRNNKQKHKNYHGITTIVKEVCKGLNKVYGKKYESDINNAINDIKDYWHILSLGEYAKKLEDWHKKMEDTNKTLDDTYGKTLSKYSVYIDKHKDIIKYMVMKGIFCDVIKRQRAYVDYWHARQPYHQTGYKKAEAFIEFIGENCSMTGFTASQIRVIQNIGDLRYEKEKYLDNIFQISHNERYALREISDDEYTMDRVRRYINNCRKDAETGALNQNYNNKLIEIYNMLNQVGGNNLEPLVAGLCDVVDMDGIIDKKTTITEQQKVAMSKRVKRFHTALQIDEEKAKQMEREEWRKYFRQAIKEALLDAKTITKEEAKKITQ